MQFDSAETAESAIQSLNQVILEGRRMAIQMHRPRPKRTLTTREGSQSGPTATLYIGNLSYNMTDRDLNNLFRPLRNVTDVRVAIDRRTGQPRGFAHADFTDVASATTARNLLLEKVIYDRKLRADYAKDIREIGPDGRPIITPIGVRPRRET
jgi:nucleolin